MASLSEIEILSLVCQKLESIRIPYMLTGSFASNFYAVPRMTRDIDIVIELQHPQIEELVTLLGNEFYISSDAIHEALEHNSMFNMIHNDSVFKIDFIIRKNVEYRKIEFQRKRQILLHDIPIWIVAPEDLILSKLFWARDNSSAMQIKDVQNLLRSVKNLDQDYLHNWIQKLHLNSIFERVHQHE